MASIGAPEYLEKLFAEAFKREVDQEENVIRSLPFFATALALAATLLGFAGSKLPPFDAPLWSPQFFVLSVVILLLCAATYCLLGVLWYLFAAIRPRTYILPPPETELIQWEKALRSFHVEAGLADAALEDAIVADLRGLMIEEYAKATTNNRVNNYERVFGRTQALSRIIMGLAFSIAIVIVTFVDVRMLSCCGQKLGVAYVSSVTAPAGAAAPSDKDSDLSGGQAGATEEPIYYRGCAPALGEGSNSKRQ